MEATIEMAHAVFQAVEMTAVVDEKHNLQLNGPVPAGIAGNVRVIARCAAEGSSTR